MPDASDVASTVVPFLSAAAGAYGAAVVQRVSDRAADATADATVGMGRRIARRLLGSSRASEVQGALVAVGEHPNDEQRAAALLAQVHAALIEDARLARDIVQILGAPRQTTVTITGSQGVQIGDGNTQTNTFG